MSLMRPRWLRAGPSYNAAIDLEEQCIAADRYHAYPEEKVLLSLPPYGFRFTNQREIQL
jgi:hypothetical protein